MNSFVYEMLPTRVIFGPGSLQRLGEEAHRLGSKALILCTPGQRHLGEAAARALGERSVGIFDEGKMLVPVETAQRARDEAVARGANVCVAIGGGSTIGLGKAIALEHGTPILAVPTTYSGSEMTPIWGLTEKGVKKTGRNPNVLPKTVIYDANLTVSLPARLTSTSGMNAMAHAVEALYAENRNPIIDLIAEESIRALARSLPLLAKNSKDLQPRSDALYGAWLVGVSLGSVGMALHHKLCHALGGSFHLPHAEVHTVILPHSVAYNEEAAPDALKKVANALGQTRAGRGLFEFERRLGTPTALSELGMRHDDLDRAAELATQNPYFNPRPVDRAAIRELLENAFYGREPN
jgi:alcohol dehydrogenase class IV